MSLDISLEDDKQFKPKNNKKIDDVILIFSGDGAKIAHISMFENLSLIEKFFKTSILCTVLLRLLTKKFGCYKPQC